MNHAALLSPVSGEYRERAREEAFRAIHLAETIRDTRLLLACAFGLNLLFLLSDTHRVGSDIYPAVLAGRLTIVTACAVAWRRLAATTNFAAFERELLIWEAGFGIGAAVIIGLTRTEPALISIFVVMTMHHFAVPLSFRWNALIGLVLGTALVAVATLPKLSLAPALWLLMLAINAMGLVSLRRINRLRRLERAAVDAEREAAAELEQLFQASPVPLTLTRFDGVLIKANDATFRHFGYAPEALLGKSIADLYVDPAERRAMVEAVRKNGQASGIEINLRCSDGLVRTQLISASLVSHGGETCLMTGLTDITRRKELEEELRRVATTDPLTGLPNRRAFFQAFDAEHARARRHGHPLTVLMLDLDHFKSINDTYGHDAGDQALRAFARLCRETLREQDMVARLGGEEFAIILTQASMPAAQPVAERLCALTEAMVVPTTRPLRVTVSIGVGELLPDEPDPYAAITRADAALYRAKADGRNCARLHDPALDEVT